DAAAMARGQTVYLPDGTVPLHPRALSEGAASLLPGQTRPAVLWTIDTGADGEPTKVDVRRALVRSTGRYDYAGVEQAFARGKPPEPVAALAELGPLRRKLAVERGAIELQLPEQEVTPDADGGWEISLRPRGDVDAWNAEISLLTGMCAARMMLDAGVGVLRTLPAADEDAVLWLRRSALALGVVWPDGASVAEILAGLDPAQPESLALFSDSTRVLRGAGYTAFDGEPPEEPGHAGIGGPYAHVTAPIRRLVDRFGTEVCLAVHAGREVPEWARAALPRLPEVMSASDSLAGRVERACLDQAEAWQLAGHVGEEFEAVVLRVDGGNGNRDGKAEVLLADPPVLAKCPADGMPEGERVTVRLAAVDVDGRSVSFEKA
ncbi:MAG: RNB domain-containing ribonuclease, partial [Thermocrispum sp.]